MNKTRANTILVYGAAQFRCLAAIAVVLCTPFAHAETNVNSANHVVDGSGNLVYTAEADGETVSFDGGAGIVYGTTFAGNTASFNPYGAQGYLTVRNPLVAIPDSYLDVAQGTVEFSGGLTPSDAITQWDSGKDFLKIGAGTAKFTGAVDFSANSQGPIFRVNEGVAHFAGSGIMHQLLNLYVGNTTSGGARAIFDNTSVNFLTGCNIAFESGKHGEVYSTNSTVTVKSGKDMNLGNEGGDALYVMKDGSLSVGDWLSLGRAAGSTAVFTNCGGTVAIAGRLYVGANGAKNTATILPGGTGTFVLDGGTATINGNGYLGTGASGSSTIRVLGGASLTMNGACKYFGYAMGSTDAPKSVLEIENGTANFNSYPVYFGYGSVANSSPRSILKIGADGTFNSTASTLVFGHEAGNIARLEMEGGTFKASNATFGNKGSFRGTMTGGNVDISQNFYLGNYSTSPNRFDMMGGTLSAANCTYRYIGYNYGNTAAGSVTSVLTVARSAVFSTGSKSMYLGFGGSATATAHGEIHLSDGGVFEAKDINPNPGDFTDKFASRKLTSDGGTFRITGNSTTIPWLRAANLESYVGRRGVTFDTGSNTATIEDFASDGKSPGQIHKAGSGTLVLGKLPQTHGGVAVKQGTLKLSSGATVGAAYTPEMAKVEAAGNTYPENASDALKGANYLLHRWSFNCGSLYDSVAAKKATVYGDIEPDVIGANENLITTPLLSNASTYLDLGSGLFGESESDFTVEFWASVLQSAGDGELAVIGKSGNSQTLIFINTATGLVKARVNGAGHNDNKYLGAHVPGTMYHYSIVFKRNANGKYDTTVCRRDSAGEVVGTSLSLAGSPFSPYLHADSFCFAASPAFPNVNTRGIKVDEVRIWKAALSDAQLAKNAILGPDELPLLDMGDDYDSIGPVDIAEGAVFDLGGNSISYGSLSGAGTVKNGTIIVTDALTPVGGTMEIAAGTTVKVTGEIVFGEGDSLNVKGTLDLREATVKYVSTSRLESAVSLAMATDGGTILGPPAAIDDSRYFISVSPSSVKVSPKGFSLIIR